MFSFREAWLRTVVLDFDGARRLCEALASASGGGPPLGQPRTIARFAAGHAELRRGRFDVARKQFEEILDPSVTPKFFLHWYWRMRAQLGLASVSLAAGDLERAEHDANRFSLSAASTAEPNLQASAWEMRARVAMAHRNWTGAADHIQSALAIVDAFDIPTVAWRVHGTGAKIYRRLGNDDAAQAHRERAAAIIEALGDSFAPGEPMRESFLGVPEVDRIRRAGPT